MYWCEFVNAHDRMDRTLPQTVSKSSVFPYPANWPQVQHNLEHISTVGIDRMNSLVKKQLL